VVPSRRGDAEQNRPGLCVSLCLRVAEKTRLAGLERRAVGPTIINTATDPRRYRQDASPVFDVRFTPSGPEPTSESEKVSYERGGWNYLGRGASVCRRHPPRQIRRGTGCQIVTKTPRARRCINRRAY